MKDSAKLIWYFHFLIVFIALALFFIPKSIWRSKIIFHFFYLWGIIFVQFVSGIIYYPFIKKFTFACPLTELEHKYHDTKSHKEIGESCIGDFLNEKFNLPKFLGTVLMIMALLIVTIQYLFR